MNVKKFFSYFQLCHQISQYISYRCLLPVKYFFVRRLLIILYIFPAGKITFVFSHPDDTGLSALCITFALSRQACCAGAAGTSPAMSPRCPPAGADIETQKDLIFNAKDAKDARGKDARAIMNYEL